METKQTSKPRKKRKKLFLKKISLKSKPQSRIEIPDSANPSNPKITNPLASNSSNPYVKNDSVRSTTSSRFKSSLRISRMAMQDEQESTPFSNPYIPSTGVGSNLSYKDILKSQEMTKGNPSSKKYSKSDGKKFDFPKPDVDQKKKTKSDLRKGKKRKRNLKINLRPIPERNSGTTKGGIPSQNNNNIGSKGVYSRARDSVLNRPDSITKAPISSHYNPYSIKRKTPIPESVKGMSSKLKPATINIDDLSVKKSDIRKIIEETFDVGREVENLVAPVDEIKAQIICDNEAAKSLFDSKKDTKCPIYFGFGPWKKFGQGIQLFFTFLCIFAAVFLILGALLLAVVVMNMTGGSDSYDVESTFLSKTTYGNLKYLNSTNYESLKNYLKNYLRKESEENVVLANENLEMPIAIKDTKEVHEDRGIQNYF